MSEHRPAVVSGGASGIGLEVAERLAGAGRSVVIVDRDVRAIEAALPGISEAARDGAVVQGRVCDVSDPVAVLDVAKEMATGIGEPETLVCAAGWGVNKPFLELSVEECRQIVDINLHGVLNCCRAFVPGMRSRRKGRVVLISSDAGRIGTPKETVYASAKAGVNVFGKALAVETARDGVTVNVVSPGSTDTSLLRGMLTDEQISKRVRANPMKRLGRPEDVAYAVLFFCSPEAGFITGQVLSVNGGMTRVD